VHAKISYRGKNKPESQKEANRAHARLRAPGERANAQLKTLAHPPQAPLLPLARWPARQGHPRIAGPRGISGMESRDRGAFTGKILSAMRPEFGRHAEKRA